MGRMRPLLMAVAVQRREEHIQGGPGAIPNVGQGACGRGGVAKNDGGSVPGNHGGHIFLAGVDVFLHRQDCPSPTIGWYTIYHQEATLHPTLLFDSEISIPESISSTTPYSPQNHNNPPSYPNLFSSPPPNPCPCKTYAPFTNYQPHPLLM